MSGLLKPGLLYKKLVSLKHTASQGPRFLEILQWGTVPFYEERSISAREKRAGEEWEMLGGLGAGREEG